MKKLLFFVCICGLTILSCNRKDSIDIPGLVGKWRMVIVKENATGLATTKPASIQGDVDITFKSISNSSGVFFGNTPTNVIMENAYSTNTNQALAISVLSMTKVAETSWWTFLLIIFAVRRSTILKVMASLLLRRRVKRLCSKNNDIGFLY